MTCILLSRELYALIYHRGSFLRAFILDSNATYLTQPRDVPVVILNLSVK